ncbi:MAG TPA: hypothetical protein VGB70_00080 [Allosphingosinicella sp.]
MTARRGGLCLPALAALSLAGCDTAAVAIPTADEAGPGAVSPTSFVEQASARPAGDSFVCTPTKLWDGDGPIHCVEGPKIRLSGIAARETDGSCKPGHPCPSASAEAARDKLAALLGRTIGTAPQGHLLIQGPALTCRSTGSAGGARTAAWCYSPDHGDLSCAMVASGTVAKWDRYWRNHRCG